VLNSSITSVSVFASCEVDYSTGPVLFRQTGEIDDEKERDAVFTRCVEIREALEVGEYVSMCRSSCV
jgi:hypothetical protein